MIRSIGYRFLIIRQKLIRYFFFRPRLNSELKVQIENLKLEVMRNSKFDLCHPEEEWKANVVELNNNIKESNPLHFLNWRVVKNTMFISSAQFVKPELEFLRFNKKDWNKKWKKALIEDRIGYPINISSYPWSSGNLIHHAYHIAKFEETVGIDFSAMDYIVEFGGGYGSMARLIRKLNFKGEYCIYDIPEFSSLQKFFLKAIGGLDFNTYFLNKVVDLDKKVKSFQRKGKGVFIATWSLSESPVVLRDEIKNLARDIEYILIAYQREFSGINNRDYFQKNFNADSSFDWIELEIEHLKGNYYLFGSKKTNSNDRS